MAEEKTIIIKNEEEKSNFTFKNYIHSIKLFRYWILGISLILGVFGYLVTSLGINKNMSKVTSTFNYSFPTTSYYAKEATLFTGEVININSINGDEAITHVYENTVNEKGEKVFASLNLQDILENSNISLTAAETTYTRTNTEPVSSDTFTLTAKVKPFKNDKLASSFLVELINYIPKKVYSTFDNYKLTNNLDSFKNSEAFVVSVDSIKLQYETIINQYLYLTNKFGNDQIVPSENKTLNELLNTFYNEYIVGSSNMINEIEAELYTNGYSNYTLSQKDNKLVELENNKKALQNEKDEKTKEKNNLESIIKSYQYVNINANSDSSSTVITTQFESYLNNLKTINQRLDVIDKYLALIDKQITNVTSSEEDYINNCAAYKNSISNLINKLNESTNNISKTFSSFFKNSVSTTALFSTSDMVRTTNSFPSIIIALVALLVGFIISSLIYTYYYVNFVLTKEIKEENTKVETQKQAKK